MSHDPEMNSGNPIISTPAELEQQFASHDYKISIGTGDGELMQEGLDMVGILRDQFGHENVLVSVISRDPDTLHLTRRQGRLGVFVVKDAARRELD